MIVTDESEVEETISLARSVLTEGKMVLIKSVSKFGVHAQVVGQIRKKVTLLKTNQDPNPSVTYFHHFSNPESALLCWFKRRLPLGERTPLYCSGILILDWNESLSPGCFFGSFTSGRFQDNQVVVPLVKMPKKQPISFNTAENPQQTNSPIKSENIPQNFHKKLIFENIFRRVFGFIPNWSRF